MIWFYKFNIKLKPNETALELFAPSWEDIERIESYQKLIADHKPRSLQIVEHQYWYHASEELRAALPEEIEQWTKNNSYLKPPFEALQPSFKYRYFGNENILTPLREKLTADYNESLLKWKTVFERNGELKTEQLGNLCVTKTVYNNLIEGGSAYPQEYMAALMQEDHPLYAVSCYFEKSGRFAPERDTKKLLDIISHHQEHLGEHEEIDSNAVKLTDYTERMELLDGNLDREYEEYAEAWIGLDFDGMCENAMDIYTIGQLYHTLRFEKEKYPTDQLYIMAQLKKPLGYDINRIIGEREMCGFWLDDLNRIFPQMYPDITPKLNIWQMPENEPNSFTVRHGQESEYQTFKENNISDPYMAVILAYAERWGGMMEQSIGDGFTLEEAAAHTKYEADTDGISGHMYGCAVNILSNYWKYGEDLRQWHNGEYGYKGNGVIDPAVVTLQSSEDNQEDTLSQEMSM